ncbi:MAG: hypothetical protein M3R36_11970 [Bacteroidota bacterium]|nr:hypothetical protein [Bacteroidota bacterium]
MNDQKNEAKKNRPLVINCRKFRVLTAKISTHHPSVKTQTGGSDRKFLLFVNTLNFFRQFITGGNQKINKNSN